MIIGTRVLSLQRGDTVVKIPITVFAPSMEKQGVWGCRYDVGWPEGSRSMTAWGFDSIQAMVLASGMIGAEIYSSDYHKSGHLFWEAPGKGYGFPVAPTLRDLLEGDDAKYL